MAKKKEESVLELPVTYGGLSVGDRAARIGLHVSRGNYTVTKADKQLCERRLTVRLIARSNGAGPDQESLPGMDNDREISAVGDVRGFTATGKAINFGITFLLSSVDVETLSHFPKRDGRIIVSDIIEIPEGSENGEDDEE